MTLQKAKEDFFRQVNDLQQHATPGKKAPANAHKSISKDYCSTTKNNLTPGAPKPPAITTYRHAADRLPSRYVPTTENPPDQDSVSS
jgi:hypothetical protein